GLGQQWRTTAGQINQNITAALLGALDAILNRLISDARHHGKIFRRFCKAMPARYPLLGVGIHKGYTVAEASKLAGKNNGNGCFSSATFCICDSNDWHNI